MFFFNLKFAISEPQNPKKRKIIKDFGVRIHKIIKHNKKIFFFEELAKNNNYYYYLHYFFEAQV